MRCADACLIECGDKAMTYAPTDAKRVGSSNRHSPFIEALSTAFRVYSDFLEARRGRRELVRLASYTDAMLSDIGIVRSDVEWALMQPWNADPSLALAMRINRRKESARWARSFWVN